MGSNSSQIGWDATITNGSVTRNGWLSYRTNISLIAHSIGAMYAQQRYINSSPPFDLGDGRVGLFIFTVINNTTGNVETVYSADVAPWHYNGMTNIQGKVDKEGRKWQMRKDMSNHGRSWEQAKTNPKFISEYAQAFTTAPLVKREVTQDILQADMETIPHPFLDNNLTGSNITTVFPVSDLNHELAEMLAAHDEFNLNELLHDGHLEISNTGLKRSGPVGILIPSFKWKQTK